MANLPEKNITTVDKITSIPSNTNLYINANGEFKQATVDDVLKASPVIADSIANQYKNASGSPILLTDSAKGVAIDFNAKGRSTQTQYSGKNLANVKDSVSQTREGITSSVTDEVITVSGTASGYNSDAPITLETRAVLESGIDYTVSLQEQTGTMPSYVTVYLYDALTATYVSYKTLTLANSVVFNLANTIECSSVLIRVNNGHTINGTFRLQIEKGATKTDYEPYVGGTASPNPDYKQTPKSNGDMGYFDGELLGGIYNTTNGVYTANNYYVCGKNPIPCVGGDTVKFIYGGIARVIYFIFFDENGVYLSKSSATNTTETSVTVPTNASYFKFNVSESTTVAITPATAKHICVTINDKYALIVDSVGKNLLKNTATTQTINGVTFTANTDGSITANGTATANINIYVGDFALEKGDYVLNGIPRGNSFSTYFMSISNVTAYDTGSGATFNVSERLEGRVGLGVTSGVTINNVTIYPMIRPLGTDATYEPYKKSRKYIPISAPLRGIGDVTDVANLSECEVTRRFASITYDGNSNIGIGSSLKYFYGPEISNAKPSSIKLISTHYKNNGGINVNYGNIYIDELSRIIFADNRFSTASEVKEWLAENPITVIYELAEPTTESIEPIEIVTYDNVTHISVSDNADMEIEYPTSKVAGIASIGWSKGRRAEYDLEQLKAQMLALQTTIVSTV